MVVVIPYFFMFVMWASFKSPGHAALYFIEEMLQV